MKSPEFSRPEPVDAADRERAVEIAADEAERAALARRFDLLAVERLEASLTIRREPGGLTARGRVTADVVQACSVTGDPVPAKVDEAVELRFVPDAGGAADEIELEADALDVIHYSGRSVDLGEAAAETMALALDPYPRSPAAAEALREAGVLSEEEARPAGGLAGLRDLLGKG